LTSRGPAIDISWEQDEDETSIRRDKQAASQLLRDSHSVEREAVVHSFIHQEGLSFFSARSFIITIFTSSRRLVRVISINYYFKHCAH
jgi:hypothetical protein